MIKVSAAGVKPRPDAPETIAPEKRGALFRTFGVVKSKLVLPEIDYEFERAGRKDAFGLVLSLMVAFVEPQTIYKLRQRQFRFVKVEYRVDI
jgi:hypothetical protein